MRKKDGQFAGGRRIEGGPIALDGADGGGAYGKLAFLVALATNADGSGRDVEILDAQGAEFADAQTAGVNYLKDGGVAQEWCGIGGGVGLLQGGEFAQGCFEQRSGLVDG